MLPIHKLLDRIRWDPRYRAGRFEIGYYDRRVNGILMVPLMAIRFPPDTQFAFELFDEEGELHRIPFHRVRRVSRNGQVIWQRSPPHEHPQEPGLPDQRSGLRNTSRRRSSRFGRPKRASP